MDRKDIEIRTKTEDHHVLVRRGGLEIRHRGKPVAGAVGGAGLVYLLIDCSYSMDGDKIAQAKRGAIGFAEEALSKGYAVGLIKFASTASLICEPMRGLSVLHPHVERLSVGGSTNMSAGIKLATKGLSKKRGYMVIVVVTDGMPDSPDDALLKAQQAKNRGVDVITIGTDDADEEFLRQLASRTDLAVMAPTERLGEVVASTGKMLPPGGDSAPDRHIPLPP